jgi:hypothetical protein
MLMLRENWTKFDLFTHGSEQKIIEQMLDTMKNNNRKVKEMASDILESFIECLSQRETNVSRELLLYFIDKVKSIIKAQQDPVEVMVCIRCFGHLSSMIKRSLGPEVVKSNFLLLYEISQNRVLDDITDSYKNIDADAIQPENFKKILYRQKQINSHIKAFALIVKEMDYLAENHAKHLIDLLMIGVRKHKLFFEGCKKYLYIAIVQLINSMSYHGSLYKFWIKKVVSEIISAFVEMTESELAQYDQDTNSVKSSAEFIVRLLKHEAWVPEVKNDFIKSLLTGIADFFAGSDFGYEEIHKQGKKLYMPLNIEDQHLTFRLALIFEEVQRHGVFDEVLPEHFEEFLNTAHKGLSKFIRTSSLQKLFKSLLSIAERLQIPLLKESPENIEIIETVIYLEFGMLRELRGDILLDSLRCLLFIPTPLLRKSNKLLEVFKRGLLLTLETSGPQCIFMLDHAVTNLERVLVKEKVDLRTTKDRFLQDTLPYFAALLDMQLEDTKDAIYTTTLQESLLEREVVLRKCISFLGSLGSDLHYMAKGRINQQDLIQTEGDVLKISIQISKQKISLNLNDIIKRASTLALESPNKEIQSAACELFHASIVVIIGKCSQGNQSNEDFVDALESSLPSIVKLAINSTAFSSLFRELLLQIARWLSLNNEEVNLLVATFIASLLELSGCGDKPEVRSLCMEAIGQFVEYTCKWPSNLVGQNFRILFLKIEALIHHPDDFKRLAGLMALRIALSQISKIEDLVKFLFFDVVYYFIMFLTKQPQVVEEDRSNDSNIVCEQMYYQIELLLKNQSKILEDLKMNNAKFVSVDDMFCNLQNNIFSPLSALREYSLRLWMLIRMDFSQLLRSKKKMAASLGFLELQAPEISEDLTLAVRCTGALFETLAELSAKGVIHERNLRESSAWNSVLSGVSLLSSGSVDDVPELTRRRTIMSLVNLAGHVNDSVRESLLGSVRKSELVSGLISSSFSSRSIQSVETCKKILGVLQVNLVQTVKEFVNRHNFRFDNFKDPVFNHSNKISSKELDSFFNTILQFMDSKTVVAELLNDVRVKVMLNFIKDIKKTEKVDAISRARAFLQFLLNCNSLKESQIAEFIDPLNSAYDIFSNMVKAHISKAPEEFIRQLIRYLFQTRKDHNQFNSILDLLQLFINSEKKTDAFFDSFNDCCDLDLMKTPDDLRSMITLSTLFIREGRQLDEARCVALLERALHKDYRGLLGLAALDCLAQLAVFSDPDRWLPVYRRLSPLLVDYSRDVLPVILGNEVELSNHMESIREFASKIFILIENSCLIEPIELIFPLIRNKKSFSVELSGVIKACVRGSNDAILQKNVQYLMAIFMDASLSESLEYNIRFSIVERVLLPMLEVSNCDYLVKLFIQIYPELETKYLESNIQVWLPATARLLQASQKACSFKLIELMFRKIGSKTIKEKIHQELIGPETKKNEITMKLTEYCMNPKKLCSLVDFEESCNRDILLQKSDWVPFIKPILLDYYTSAYSCLTSVLLSTQSKEGPFCRYLLSSEPRDLVLSNIIDTKQIFAFPVSADYRLETLNDFYLLDCSSTSLPNRRAAAQDFVEELAAASLYLQPASRRRLLPAGLDTAGLRDTILRAADGEELLEHQAEDREAPANGATLKMDPINIHPAMKNLVRLVDFLQANFGQHGGSETPVWINTVIRLFEDHEELNQRLLLLKLVMNRSNIFKPFRSLLNQYLLQYIGLTEANGGAGFHYFLRDVCTTLITWNQDDDDVTVAGGAIIQKKLCYFAIQNLCKKLADQSKPVFLVNIEIFKRLCHLMRRVLILDEDLIFNLLMYGHKKGDTGAKPELNNKEILWRLTGISILETSIFEGIEVGQFDLSNNPAGLGSGGSGDNTISHVVELSQSQPSMSQKISAHQTLTSALSTDLDSDNKRLIFKSKLLDAVVFNISVQKNVIYSAAFRLAGLYLNYLSGRLPYSSPVYEAVKTKILNEIQTLVNKGHSNMEVSICELCKIYPEIACENKVLKLLTTFISNTSGKTRGYIFDSLKSVYTRCLKKPEILERVADEIIVTLEPCLGGILSDTDPNNMRSFLVLLTELSKLTCLKRMRSFLELNFEEISSSMMKIVKNDDSIYFFDFLVQIFENYKELKGYAKRYLARGISNPNDLVRKMVFGLIEKEGYGISTEVNLLDFILRDFYHPDFEHEWLKSSAQLIVNLAVSTGHINKMIFDQPLEEYVGSGHFSFPTRMNYVSQMTQPFVPIKLVAPSLMDDEQIIKVKSKYWNLVSEAEYRTDELPDNIFFSESEAMTAKLIVDALIKPEHIKSGLHRANLRDFLRKNQISLKTEFQTGDNKLRMVETVDTIMSSKTTGSSEPGYLRRSQKSELPDIQLKYSDIMIPLGVLAAKDGNTAQMLFVQLFIAVYKHQQQETDWGPLKMVKQLLNIINQSRADFFVIHTVQSLLYEITLLSTLVIDPTTISKTGTKSLSLAGAAILLEEMLIRLQRELPRDSSIEKETKKVLGAQRRNNYLDDLKFVVYLDDPQTIALVLSLIDIYKQMNEEDIVHGLQKLIYAKDSVANEVFDLKIGKRMMVSLQILEEMVVASKEDAGDKEQMLQDLLVLEKRETLQLLNKWDDLIMDSEQGTENKFFQCNCINFKKSQKKIFEKDQSYELSLDAVTEFKFEKAKYYLDKFKDKFLQHWTGVKDLGGIETKTEVITELLRQHELEEFLICTRHFNVEGMVASPDLERFRTTLEGWLSHDSAKPIENFNYLSDSFQTRCLFIDIMKNRHQHYNEQDINMHHLKASLSYANGLIKMGHVDTADLILKKANDRNERNQKFLQSNISLDFELANLMVHSGLKGISRDVNYISREMDGSKINLEFLNNRFKKLDLIIENLTPKNGLDSLDSMRFSLLKILTKSRKISAIKDYLGPAFSENEDQYIPLICEESLSLATDNIKKVGKIENLEKLIGKEYSGADLLKIKAKLYQTICEITENYMRWFKAKASDQNLSLSNFSNREPVNRILEVAKELVTNVAQLTNLGIFDHSKLLFTFEIVVEFSVDLGLYFIKEFNEVPLWIYIKWMPQLIGYLNNERNAFWLPVIKRILDRYREPVIYAICAAIDARLWPLDKNSNLRELQSMMEDQGGDRGIHMMFISHLESSYSSSLSLLSNWLCKYNIDNYPSIDNVQRLEVPGQYRGETEPVPQLHVKIAKFLPDVQIIQSKNKPRKFSILGTNQKVYDFLLKGGEDIRLDQRIEQLFSIMNSIFENDHECAKREVRIGTYNVIPLNRNLGIMEWVKNTSTLGSMMENQMDKDAEGKLYKNRALDKRLVFLEQIAGDKDIKGGHLALLSEKREQIVNAFNEQLKHFRHTLLKTAIKKKVHNGEQFIKIRKRFLTNYAALSLGSYILGVGDRHPGNFLFNYVNGQVVAIDFGYSFGIGVELDTPELMPFRLTQNFMELLYPLGVQGVFRNSMIVAMKALKAQRNFIIDSTDVFISDPPVEWLKIVEIKAQKEESQKPNEVAVCPVSPEQRMAVVRQKLAGISPVTVMLNELTHSHHRGQAYFPNLEAILKGDSHRARAKLGLAILPLGEQVDILIDLSTDPDILGRSWTYWAPYV